MDDVFTKEVAPKQPNQHSVATAVLLATWRTMRRLFILLIGITVLLLGVVMVITPGPAILVIPIGLMILGIEFAWARRWLAKFKSYLPKKKVSVSTQIVLSSETATATAPVTPG